MATEIPKELIIVAGLLVVGLGGWLGTSKYREYQADKIKHAAAFAQAALPKPPSAEAKKAADDAAKHQKELAAARHEIEESLKPLKVSSIMIGSPNLAIIDKEEYEEGGELPLSGGRRLKITSIRDDGILLAFAGENYRLDPPGPPVLAHHPK